MIYRQLWKFIKESRIYFLIIGLIFAASIIIGLIFPVFFIDFIKQFIEQISAKTAGMNFLQLFAFILANNLQTAFIGMIFGALFGILPVVFSLFNGYVLGFVSGKVVLLSGASNLWRLFPHGIFEIPAVILSLGLGLRLGMFFLAKKGKRKREFFHTFFNSIKVFFYIILPLLIIASLIESWLIVMLK